MAAVIAIPSGVAMVGRPTASVRSNPCTTASTTRLGTNSPSVIEPRSTPGRSPRVELARASSTVLENVSCSTSGMSPGFLPATMV